MVVREGVLLEVVKELWEDEVMVCGKDLCRPRNYSQTKWGGEVLVLEVDTWRALRVCSVMGDCSVWM